MQFMSKSSEVYFEEERRLYPTTSKSRVAMFEANMYSFGYDQYRAQAIAVLRGNDASNWPEPRGLFKFLNPRARIIDRGRAALMTLHSWTGSEFQNSPDRQRMARETLVLLEGLGVNTQDPREKGETRDISKISIGSVRPH